MSNRRGIRKNFRARNEEPPVESSFMDALGSFFRGGIRGSDAPIGIGPRTAFSDVQMPVPASNEMSPYEAPELIPNLRGMPDPYLQGPVAYDAPVVPAAAVKKKTKQPVSKRRQAPVRPAPVAMPETQMVKRPSHADRLAMLDSAYGAGSGYGVDW